MTRRHFLAEGAAAVAGAFGFPTFVSAASLGKGRNTAPSQKINVGCIGVGPQGRGVMGNFLRERDCRVVAVCDVKTHVLQGAQQAVNNFYGGSGCAAYSDFRELLARDDIDAVLIATPDHWHVPVAVAAAEAGKDMYVEKPLGLSLAEDWVLQQVVHRYGCVFQFGTQQRSDAKFRLACELARNGRIGRLHTINVWSPASASGGSSGPVPVPDWLDYDMWLGPAPYVPYSAKCCSNEIWWYVSDYALGFIAGWGIHPLDIAMWGGGDILKGTVQVEGSAVFPSEGVCDTATSWDVTFNFPGGVQMNFTSGPRQEWIERYGTGRYHGTAFEGTEGWVVVDRTEVKAHPHSLLRTVFGPDEQRLYESRGHVRNLLDCVRTRSETICPVEEAVWADTLCHISNIATRIGVRLEWDPQKGGFVGNDAANRMLGRSMRSPWRV